jgi:ATP-dependent exoDNAse (exonuclease V) beta subunit
MAMCDGIYLSPPFVVVEEDGKGDKGDGKSESDSNSDDAITFLKKKNPHVRDARISFDAGPHIYTIDNDPSVKYTSVTTWNHQHFEEFDADAIITRMMSGKNWKLSKYYGMTRDKIKATWDKTRDDAAAAGTLMHYNIERVYNGCGLDQVDDGSSEFQYFRRFHADHAEHLEPFRTEWTIFHEEHRLSGSIDIVFRNLDDGTFSIYDWKRSKEIKKTAFGGAFAKTQGIEHLPDSNFWHYSLQLNTYKTILEQKYDMVIRDMFLVCLHPDNPNKSYIKLKVPDLSDEMRELLPYNK